MTSTLFRVLNYLIIYYHKVTFLILVIVRYLVAFLIEFYFRQNNFSMFTFLSFSLYLVTDVVK